MVGRVGALLCCVVTLGAVAVMLCACDVLRVVHACGALTVVLVLWVVLCLFRVIVFRVSCFFLFGHPSTGHALSCSLFFAGSGAASSCFDKRVRASHVPRHCSQS